jgi:hypothetical protein
MSSIPSTMGKSFKVSTAKINLYACHQKVMLAGSMSRKLKTFARITYRTNMQNIFMNGKGRKIHITKKAGIPCSGYL